MTSHAPTDEQAAILEAANDTNDNLLLNALAGTGKTSTLEMISKVNIGAPVLYLVFNKRNAEEAEGRFPTTTTIRTFNGLGHRIWAKACVKNLRVDPKKPHVLLREIISAVPKTTAAVMWDCYWEVIQGVNLARALGYVPDGKFPNAHRLISRSSFHASLDETPDDLVGDLIDAVLTKSIQTAYEGFIDFNDQVYMPPLFGGTFPRFPLVKVDEYQDLNPVNHAMLDKLVKGRLIGVGDPWQSIYAFRGAKRGGMAEARAKFSMTEMDLSISFRCPQAIVEASQWRVPHFKWIKPGGIVGELRNPSVSGFADGAAILSRNNAPLFRLAMACLMAGRSVSVAGSEIGPKLVALMRKLGDEDMRSEALLDAIESWRAERAAKESTTANDLADCMRVFASHGTDLGQAIAYAEHLFKQQGTLRFLTGHKSKGLEFPVVYHLDPHLCSDEEQDQNLRYVITTRSEGEYYEINSKDIR